MGTETVSNPYLVELVPASETPPLRDFDSVGDIRDRRPPTNDRREGRRPRYSGRNFPHNIQLNRDGFLFFFTIHLQDWGSWSLTPE